MRTFLFLVVSAVTAVQAYKDVYNVQYGSHPRQVMDIYSPSKMTNTNKAFLVIHGGGWVTGSKIFNTLMIPFFLKFWPDHMVVNINHRLGSLREPGYPQQMEDVGKAVSFAESYAGKNLTFTLIGSSSGAHLSMLYAYKIDKGEKVKCLVDIVGPSDLTDPFIAQNPAVNMLLFPFLGMNFYKDNPNIYKETSPVTWINGRSPKTISFYGLSDPFIPKSQAKRLKRKLDKAGVTYEQTLYDGGHYNDWNPMDRMDMYWKIFKFINAHF